MKIIEALKEINLKKNQLKRLYDIRQDNFKIIIPKNMSLEEALIDFKSLNIIKFDEITERISKLSSDIMIMREKILITNISTIVHLEEIGDISLSRLKLMIDEIRSELAQLNLYQTKRGGFFDSKKFMSTDDEEKEVAQMNSLELENLVQENELKKIKMESILDKINAKTDLLSSLNQ